MGLKLGQNINFWLFFLVSQRFWSRQGFLVATEPSGRDTGRDILLVATLVVTYYLSRHWSRHTTCRDTGRDSLLGRDTGRDILPVATYYPGRDILPDSNLFFFSNLSGT